MHAQPSTDGPTDGSGVGVPGVDGSSGRPLRVCHLAYTFYESDNRVLRYAAALVERGDDVEVLALRRPDQEKVADVRGVRVFRIQRRAKTERAPATYLVKILWFLLKSMVLLSLRHLRRPYDIVHVHNVPDFLVFAAWLPKLMGARVILDIHDLLPELYGGKFATESAATVFRGLLLAERLSCRFADHVFVANHLWHGRLIQRAVSAEQCTAILNYPDLRVFKPVPAERKPRDGRFIILYPGSLSRHQGLDVAIEALALVSDRMPTADLHIYGEGPARSSLMQLVIDRGLGGRVVFFDPLPIDQIAAVMASASVGVEPKQGTGFGNEALSTKILEFMSCGVPVIASRTQVHASYFDETVLTFFAPGDTAGLARALVDVYDHYPERLAGVERARTFAAGYSWQRRVTDYYGVIESLCVETEAAPRALLGRPVSGLKAQK